MNGSGSVHLHSADHDVADSSRLAAPAEEASALCLRHDAASQSAQLLAVDDEQYKLALAAIDSGVVPAAEAEDVGAAVADGSSSTGGSDFEGVASDASRQVFVLQEGADRVLVLDEKLGAVNRTIALSVPRDQPDFGAEWHEDDNARGEGLIMLRNGHILVAKQRNEPRLIEFGPRGDEAGGFAPRGRLDPDGTLVLPDGGDLTFGVLASWPLHHDSSVESVNDLALDADGRLHLVSSKSRSLARVDNDLDPDGGTAALTAWPLPEELFETEDDRLKAWYLSRGSAGWWPSISSAPHRTSFRSPVSPADPSGRRSESGPRTEPLTAPDLRTGLLVVLR